MIKAGHIMQIEVIIGTIRLLEARTTIEMVEIEVNIIEVIEETLRTETGHMIEAEAGMETIE